MPIALVRFGCTFLVMTASAMALLVCIGVGGCLCPILPRMILISTASLAMMYSAASSASVANDMTCFIMCAMLRIALLFAGIPVSSDRKKLLPQVGLVDQTKTNLPVTA